MFTGIVEELGVVTQITHARDSARLQIEGEVVTQDVSHGDSISVNGVCLTVTQSDGATFETDVMAQTLQHSSIGGLEPGSPVNLERALRVDGRFGGHVVQGHVETTTSLLRREPGEAWEVLTFALPAAVARYLVAQGSVTLDGVSLTVSHLGHDTFSVSLIPTTLSMTTLGSLATGRSVNVEVDVLAKYVERLLTPRGGEDDE
ncbi:MAG TPA: riboflavin synthase [Ornithinimicrobium sp.]|uniref:riboflavin synthase n=1 Tax=Ornithinimicrobium sp. TaxID=1977084 RepID=UPI002B496C7C|nr:riboflavin synthase [Ornithinimicrobium sp.]HKJ12162.1 riboflavin synthase [Ornithinimicrobium sp.]